MENSRQVLLKNGLIVDGTGKKAWKGSLLIKGDRIEALKPEELLVEGDVLDCNGLVIAPGFIDAHSHNDWYLPLQEAETFTNPFIRQGITTMIGGNCGFSVGALRRNTPFLKEVCANPFQSSGLKIGWSAMAEYYEHLSHQGIPVNFACMAGHGTTRSSIRGYDPQPLSSGEMKALAGLLDQAMEDGARGISLGLQYQPGIFSNVEELKQVAKLVKKRDKILTVHSRASSALSGSYPIQPFGKPHSILALNEMIDLARETGIRLEYSHLIFVGEKTWKTFDRTMQIIDNAIADGVDVRFDLYAYTCGASVISVVLPEWFMARIPQCYESRSDLACLQAELTFIKTLLGFGYEDIQIASIDHPELKAFNGRFIPDIAKELGLSDFEAFILFVKHSNGKARVMQYRFSNPSIIEALMQHPASIFMTDAWVERVGVQNPACYGCFPRFLQIAREKGILSLEDAVHKMTQAAAERFALPRRGVLKEGNPADITVFDWNAVCDHTSPAHMDAAPSGIENVFINGTWVIKAGEFFERQRAGQVLT